MADNSGQAVDDLRFALAAVDNGDARRIRESVLMSKAELAAILGVSERMITHYENRTRIVSANIGRIYGAVLRQLQARAEDQRLIELRDMARACPACVVRSRVDYLMPLPHSCTRSDQPRESGFHMSGDDQ